MFTYQTSDDVHVSRSGNILIAVGRDESRDGSFAATLVRLAMPQKSSAGRCEQMNRRMRFGPRSELPESRRFHLPKKNYCPLSESIALFPT
jgi:hypothetical protein